DGDAHPRRLRPAVRRVRRRRDLHGSAGLPVEGKPAVLAVLGRAAARAHRAVRAARPARPVRGCGADAHAGAQAVTAALEIRDLNKDFGALAVARDIRLELPKGARHALIGPNGAGKTTLVNLITGVLRPSAGAILLDGGDITSLPQAERTRRGIARTFQINQLFRGLTVLENVYLAVAERMGASGRLWRPAGAERAVIEQALDQLEALRLADDALKPVRELPYG